MSEDDHPGGVTTDAVVSVGGSVDGGLETAGDRDWFKVRLRAGVSYYFTLDGLAGGLAALRDPVLRLHDGAGEAISDNDDSGGGLGSRIVYTAAYTGYYYLDVGSYNDSQAGGYRLTVGSYDDDNTSLDPATLAVGQSLTGSLEAAGDIDWVRLELTAGVTYAIGLQGVDSGQGTLADPALFVYDGEGGFLASDDDGSGRRDSLLNFTPTGSGAYYLALGAYDNLSTGSYRLSLTARTDDFAQGGGEADATGELAVGGSATGELEKAGDVDGFGVELTAGRTYYFDLQGADSGQGSLADPYLWLRDGAGNRLAFDDDGGLGRDSRIVFTPAVSGTYYLQAGGFDGKQSGTYLVSARELPSSDDAGAGRITAYGVTEGRLDSPGEHDWVALALEASTTYLLALEGGGEDGLPDPTLVLRDAQGGQAVFGQTGAGPGADTLLFTPGQSGLYYVDIGAAGENDAGRYLLTIVGRQVEQFASGAVYGDWSAVDLFAGQTGSNAGLAAMTDAGQGAAAGLTAGHKDDPGGVLAAGS